MQSRPSTSYKNVTASLIKFLQDPKRAKFLQYSKNPTSYIRKRKWNFKYFLNLRKRRANEEISALISGMKAKLVFATISPLLEESARLCTHFQGHSSTNKTSKAQSPSTLRFEGLLHAASVMSSSFAGLRRVLPL